MFVFSRGWRWPWSSQSIVVTLGWFTRTCKCLIFRVHQLASAFRVKAVKAYYFLADIWACSGEAIGSSWMAKQAVWRIRDVYPGSQILIFTHPGSRILDPDPGSKNSNKRDGWKKFFCHNFLCSHKFHKIANYFSFEGLKKKIWPNFQRIIELFTQKIVNKLSKIWVWDLGSGIRDPRSGIQKKPIPDPRSRIQVLKRHRIPDPDPQHWKQVRCSNSSLLECSPMMQTTRVWFLSPPGIPLSKFPLAKFWA